MLGFLCIHFYFQEFILTEDSLIYSQWRKLIVPLYIYTYVYHVVNPEGIENGEKPIVEQKGPYVYVYVPFRYRIIYSSLALESEGYRRNLW